MVATEVESVFLIADLSGYTALTEAHGIGCPDAAVVVRSIIQSHFANSLTSPPALRQTTVHPMVGRPRRIVALFATAALLTALHCGCLPVPLTVVAASVSGHDCCPAPADAPDRAPARSRDRATNCAHCGANVIGPTQSGGQLRVWSSVQSLVWSHSPNATTSHFAKTFMRPVRLDGCPPRCLRTLVDLSCCLII